MQQTSATALKVGLGISAAGTVVADARAAEQAGYDFIGCGDHLFFHGPTPSTFIHLAAAAGATSTLGLVTTIALAPLYPPAMLAKLAAALDVVSHGRFELGLGAGGENAAEFEAVGVPVESRFKRLEETLVVLRRLFAGGTVDYDGVFTRLPGVELLPGPVQPGGPPIWLAGRKDGAMRRAGRHADVWMPYMIDPGGLARTAARVGEYAEASGRAPGSVAAAAFLWVCADDDGDWARSTGIRHVSQTYGQDFAPLADRYLVLGTPEEVAARLGEYAAAGATRIVLQRAAPAADQERLSTTLAHGVLPLMRPQS